MLDTDRQVWAPGWGMGEGSGPQRAPEPVLGRVAWRALALRSRLAFLHAGTYRVRMTI